MQLSTKNVCKESFLTRIAGEAKTVEIEARTASLLANSKLWLGPFVNESLLRTLAQS